MNYERLMWQSQSLAQETGRDAAARFVRETFGAEREIQWGHEPGEFRFADGYWCYRVTFDAGNWQVHRMEKMTPKAKERAKARAEIKAVSDEA
jgi:hypothetical protein